MIRIENEFSVDATPADAWALLIDMERVAPCMPGATLLGVDDDVFSGSVVVKVGPIRAKFDGTAKFDGLDHDKHEATIVAKGKDLRGRSAADAVVSAKVVERAGGSQVLVSTDLQISGRIAQFGRGAIADVSAAVLRSFADNLNTQLASGSTAPADEPAASGSAPQPPAVADAAPLRLDAVIGRTLALPLCALAAAIVGLVALKRRRRRRSP